MKKWGAPGPIGLDIHLPDLCFFWISDFLGQIDRESPGSLLKNALDDHQSSAQSRRRYQGVIDGWMPEKVALMAITKKMPDAFQHEDLR